jgi:protein-disulfide isomerase
VKYNLKSHKAVMANYGHERIDGMLYRHMNSGYYKQDAHWDKYSDDRDALKGLLYTMAAMKLL